MLVEYERALSYNSVGYLILYLVVNAYLSIPTSDIPYLSFTSVTYCQSILQV
jgi:hypothetical protein